MNHQGRTIKNVITSPPTPPPPETPKNTPRRPEFHREPKGFPKPLRSLPHQPLNLQESLQNPTRKIIGGEVIFAEQIVNHGFGKRTEVWKRALLVSIFKKKNITFVTAPASLLPHTLDQWRDPVRASRTWVNPQETMVFTTTLWL